MSDVTVSADIGNAPPPRVWRTETGTVLAMVYLDDRDAHLTFDSQADARAVASACTQAADEMARAERADYDQEG